LANALITGASSGIGLSTARRLAQRGHQILLLSENEPELLQVSPGLGIPVLCDLGRPEQLQGLWAGLEENYGPIEILINNAGIGCQADVLDTDMARFRQVMEINYFAPVELCRQALAAMAGRGQGKILNVTSAAARRSLARIGAYGASKAALHAFTQTLRLEAAAQGVTVGEVLPISVRTPFFARAGYRPRGLTQSPEQVAEHILGCLDRGQAERTTHWPTALGFALEALFPNWVAGWLQRLPKG
jgi:short-subunit dehydrogenase